jgi:hypothetical protein
MRAGINQPGQYRKQSKTELFVDMNEMAKRSSVGELRQALRDILGVARADGPELSDRLKLVAIERLAARALRQEG